MTSQIFEYQEGEIPLLLSFPHAGTQVPEDVLERMSSAGRQLPDTDWFTDRLFDLPEARRAYRIKANFSRYVIDLNRAATDENLYPGLDTTGLCPTTTFDSKPVYQAGCGLGETKLPDGWTSIGIRIMTSCLAVWKNCWPSSGERFCLMCTPFAARCRDCSMVGCRT